ncbi:hypothetical protein [Bradyrhizobium elkanii]|uniref:hypothetical protein n=1 Tax=Bradyrhizobium elkanii TaxID=29448 RepID=UPI000487A9A1|nr:hypothetical protein [Bradyrhizobium elkanii]
MEDDYMDDEIMRDDGTVRLDRGTACGTIAIFKAEVRQVFFKHLGKQTCWDDCCALSWALDDISRELLIELCGARRQWRQR